MERLIVKYRRVIMINKNDCLYSVYMHIFPNGKRYVGITAQKPKDRWRVNGNGYKPQKMVYSAIKKYGWNNIEHIIVKDNLSVSDAAELEKALIAKYQTTNSCFGYNQSIGGENSPIGVKRSEETKQKLSISHKGKVTRMGFHLSEKQKQHLREINLGKKMSEEVKAKISQKNKGQKPTALAIQKAKEACNKAVICISTGIVYESATIASAITGEHRNTITRHCRNEVRNPRWMFQK